LVYGVEAYTFFARTTIVDTKWTLELTESTF